MSNSLFFFSFSQKIKNKVCPTLPVKGDEKNKEKKRRLVSSKNAMQGIYFVRSYFLFFLLLFCFFYNTLTQSNFLSVLYIQGGRTGVDDQLAICTQHFVGCAKKKENKQKKTSGVGQYRIGEKGNHVCFYFKMGKLFFIYKKW